TVGEKTGWFAGLECRYFGKRPLTVDGAFWSPATGLLNVRLWKVLKTLMSTGLMACPWPSSWPEIKDKLFGPCRTRRVLERRFGGSARSNPFTKVLDRFPMRCDQFSERI